MSKRVLVEYGERRKPLCIDTSDLSSFKDCIMKSFDIPQLTESQCFIIQIQDEEWGGVWVDVEDYDSICDKSFLKVLVVGVKESVVISPTTTSPCSMTTPGSTSTATVHVNTQARVSSSSSQMKLGFTPGGSIQLEKPTEMEHQAVPGNCVPDEVIHEQAKIFTESEKYQREVNSASVELCKKNPSLLMGKKGELMRLAKEKVHDDGYVYKKGKSRAKRFLSCSSNSSEDGVSSNKRSKINSQERQSRINDLVEQIADIDKRTSYKQRRINTAAALNNFKSWDDLSQEIYELKSQKRELDGDLALLQKKVAKSAWYQKAKKRKSKAQSPEDESTEPLSESEISDISHDTSVFMHSGESSDHHFLNPSPPTEILD